MIAHTSPKLVNKHFPFSTWKQSFESCCYSAPLLEGLQGSLHWRHMEGKFDHCLIFL